jgi:hypothetical protein
MGAQARQGRQSKLSLKIETSTSDFQGKIGKGPGSGYVGPFASPWRFINNSRLV